MPLKKAILRLFAQRQFIQTGPAAPPNVVLSALKGYFRSFGTLNRDDTFYVIWRKNHGAGFFSNFSFVLAHMKVALDNQMIPIVDFENFPTLYNETQLIDGERNSWMYYFSQPSDHSLAEVYSSKSVFFCDGIWPPGLSMNISKIPGLFTDVYEKKISFSPALISRLREAEHIISAKTLGLHFRGKDQNLAPGHWFGPTVQQIFGCIDSILSRHDIDKIFVGTDEPSYLRALVGRYGDRITYLDSYRSKNVIAYNENPRERHRYLLGMEVCVEGILLSRCVGLLCGSSNVSEFAVFHNNGKFKFIHSIDNGRNSDRALLAAMMYRARTNLPTFFGGLKNDLVITEGGITRRTKVETSRYKPRREESGATP